MASVLYPNGNTARFGVEVSRGRDSTIIDDRNSFSAKVAASGNSALLVERNIDRYGHCDFTPAELGTAFSDLVLWVELGIKPTP